MDISELLPYAVILLVLVSLVAFFVIAQRSPKRWVRWSVLVGAGAGIALTVLVLAWLVLGDMLTARAPLIYSPDGRHVAVIRVPNSEDYATVKVRHRYSPFAESVFSGIEPQVRWIDNNHLLVRYDIVREPYGDWREEDHDCVPHALDVEISCEHPIHYVDPKPAIAYGDEYYSELKQRQVDNALAMYTNGLIEKRGDEWRRLITDLDRQQGSVTDFKEVDWLAIGIGPFPDSTDLNCIKVKYRVTRNSLVSREILLVCPHQRGADWGISEHEIDAGQLGHLYESGSTFKEEKTILNK